jgi:hypothetical protein
VFAFFYLIVKVIRLFAYLQLDVNENIGFDILCKFKMGSQSNFNLVLRIIAYHCGDVFTRMRNFYGQLFHRGYFYVDGRILK